MSETKTTRSRRPGGGLDWHRTLPVACVLAALAALLIAGRVIPAHPAYRAAPLQSETLLSRVDIGARSASVWNCPGPLQLSGGATSTISIVNPGPHLARAAVLVAESVVTASQPTGAPLQRRLLNIEIGPSSEEQLPLTPEPVPASLLASSTAKKSHGGSPPPVAEAVDASVSVTATGASVAVSEGESLSTGLVSSPCAVGSAVHGYTASGSTVGSSDTHLAVFDPADAPAVVDVSVGTPAGLLQPEAYQGLVIAPKSLLVLDLAKYVPQRNDVAVEASATVGRVVIGSLSTMEASFRTRVPRPAHSYLETGDQLAVGVGSPLAHWVSPLGPSSSDFSEAVQLYDPGARPAEVTVRTESAGGVSSLSLTVEPGETLTTGAPALTSSPAPAASNTATTTSTEPAKKGHGTKAKAPSPPARSPLPAASAVLAVSSTNGVGIVVEHESYETLTAHHVVLEASSPSDVSPRSWVLPGEQQSRAVDGGVTVTNAGKTAASVVVEEIYPNPAGSTPRAPLVLKTFLLGRAMSLPIPLGPLVAAGSPGEFGLEVKASGAVIVTGGLVPADRSLQSAVFAGVPAG